MSLDNNSSDVKETRLVKTSDVLGLVKPHAISKAKLSSSISSADANLNSKMGSRRIFTPHFKLQVLESYRNDGDCKGNQRATARKYNIHRRQIQKWLQCETNLRSSLSNADHNCTLRHDYHDYHNITHSSKISDRNPSSIKLATNVPSCEDDLHEPLQFKSELVTLNSSETLSKKLFLRKIVPSKPKAGNFNKIFSTEKVDNNSHIMNAEMKFSKHVASSSVPQTNIFFEPTYNIDHRHLYHYKIPYMHANTSAGIPQTLPISTHCDQSPLQLFPHFRFHERVLPHAHAHPHIHTMNMLQHANTSGLSYLPTPSLPMVSFSQVASTTQALTNSTSMFFNMETMNMENSSVSSKSAQNDNNMKNQSKLCTAPLQSISSFYTLDKSVDTFENSNKDVQISPTGPIDLSSGARDDRTKNELPTTSKEFQYGMSAEDRTLNSRKKFCRRPSDSSHTTDAKLSEYLSPESVDQLNEKNQPFKRIKLFKPYLLDNQEQTSNEESTKEITNNIPEIYPESRARSEHFFSLCLENKDLTKKWIDSVAPKNVSIRTSSFESSAPQSSPELIRCPPKGSPVSGYESSTSTFSEFSIRKEMLRDDDIGYTDTYSLELKLQNINKHYLNFNENSVQKWLEREVAAMTSADTSVTLYA